MKRRRRAPRGEGGQLREEILTATEALLIETGSSEAVSIRAVAQRVGVTPPSIYRHFADKDELLVEVCARRFHEFNAELEAAVGGIGDPVDALVARGRAYVQFATEHPGHYRIMFMTPVDPVREDFLAGMQEEGSSFGNLVRNLDALVACGAIARGADTARLAYHVWFSLHGLATILITQPHVLGTDVAGLVEEHLAFVLGGLGAGTERAAADAGSGPGAGRR